MFLNQFDQCVALKPFFFLRSRKVSSAKKTFGFIQKEKQFLLNSTRIVLFILSLFRTPLFFRTSSNQEHKKKLERTFNSFHKHGQNFFQQNSGV